MSPKNWSILWFNMNVMQTDLRTFQHQLQCLLTTGHAFWTILFLSILLSGCGFHLRGNKPITPALHNLFIDSAEPYSGLTKQLELSLRSLQIQIAKEPTEAPVTLKLSPQLFKSTTLSRGASSTFKEYTLSLTTTYQLQDKDGNLLYGPKVLKASRSLLIVENQVLSASNEQAVLKQDMQRDIMYQLLNQLSSDEVTNLFNKEIETVKPSL